MNQTTKTIALLLTAGLLVTTSCGDPREKLYSMYHEQVASVGDINDEMVLKYIKTYRNLRSNGQNFLQYISEDPARGQDGYAAIEKIIKEGGFKDYPEFVRVNAKIAWAWNMAQARVGMNKQKKLQKWAHHEMDGGIKQVEEALANPDVPEETKKELRKTLAQLKKGKTKLKSTYDKNLKWANWAMKMTIPLTNEKDIKVILRHEKGLMEVFTGLSREQLDQIHEHSMRALEIK